MSMTDTITRATKTIDASGQSIGRLASEIAKILQGKHKATYRPNIDMGDFVEVRHAAQVKVTGNKLSGKTYYRYSGYPGGLKRTVLKDVFAKDPGEALRRAVRNMLPKNRLRDGRMKRLTVHND